MDFDRDDSKAEQSSEKQDDLRPEYGETELKKLLTSGIRGKYVERYCNKASQGLLKSKMEETFDVHLTLTKDSANSMDFTDTYIGLDQAWYKFEADEGGNIALNANAEGFEHLARYFFKTARTGKAIGYHAHHSLELEKGDSAPLPELTIGMVEAPEETG